MLIEKYGDVINQAWEDTPKSITDFLILKPYHLISLRNLRDFKKNNRIKNSLTRIIEFNKNTNEIIHIPSAAGMSWDKIQDVTDSKKYANQVIEED